MSVSNTSAAAGGFQAPPKLTPQQSSALIRSALAIAHELMAHGMSEVINKARDAMLSRRDFDAASPHVARLLTSQADEFSDAFIQHVPALQEEACARLLAVKDGKAARASVDISMLELVVEADDGGDALVARTAGRARGAIEEPMRDLESILSYLGGTDQLRFTDDPVGPEVFFSALLRAAIDTELPPDAWGYFLTVMEHEFGAQVGATARALLDHFRTQGIVADGVRRARHARRLPPPPSGAAGTGRGADGSGPGAGGAGAGGSGDGQGGGAARAGAGSESLADAGLMLQEILSRLQGNFTGTAIPPSLANQGPVPQGLLRALSELQGLRGEGVHGAAIAGAAPGSANVWREHLITQSDRTVDKLTIEIVGMLFDQIMRDEQVPSEIKAILSRLQIPVLKSALLDAAFFSSGAHPARRLIDRFASAAVGWEPYGDENERFRAEVERLVDLLLHKFEGDSTLFDQALSQFEAFLSDIGPRETDPIARAKRALEEAEKREILTINTTIQVRRAFERIHLEPYLREFLLGPWVQVLVQASLRDDQTKGFSKSFREVIHEIVWSVQPKATVEERRRLVEMIPVITRVVRDGLKLIRMSQHDQEEFLQKLMGAHAFAVKPTDQATYIKNALQSSEVRAKIESLQLTSSFPLNTVPGGMRMQTQEVLRAAADHQVELTVPPALTEAGTIDRTQEARMDQELANWTRGSWFELWHAGAFIKVRLRWISPLRTMFLFSSGSESRPHVLSPELIRSYLRRDYIRPLERAPLMERAAQAVAEEYAKSPKTSATVTGAMTPVSP